MIPQDSSRLPVNIRRRKLWLNVLTGCALFSLILLFFVSRSAFIGFAQVSEQKYKIVTRVTYPFEPLEIVAVGNSEKLFALDERFEANGDWLKGFHLKIRNDTSKSVTYLVWQFDFPETASPGPILVSANHYGVTSKRKVDNEPPVPPGGFLDQRLSEKDFNALKRFIQKVRSLESLTHANIRIMEIRFDDGTGWNAGSLTQQDISDPDRYRPTRLYRPGGGDHE